MECGYDTIAGVWKVDMYNIIVWNVDRICVQVHPLVLKDIFIYCKESAYGICVI